MIVEVYSIDCIYTLLLQIATHVIDLIKKSFHPVTDAHGHTTLGRSKKRLRSVGCG